MYVQVIPHLHSSIFVSDGSSKTSTVSVTGANFAWAPGVPDTLHNVNLHIEPGQLVMIVGEVGAGKSSLLASMLGEMHQQGGTVQVAGSVAYTAQVSLQESSTCCHMKMPVSDGWIIVLVFVYFSLRYIIAFVHCRDLFR